MKTIAKLKKFKLLIELFGRESLIQYKLDKTNSRKIKYSRTILQKGLFIFQELSGKKIYDFEMTMTGPFSSKLNDDIYQTFLGINGEEVEDIVFGKSTRKFIKITKKMLIWKYYDQIGFGNCDWSVLAASFLYYKNHKGYSDEKSLRKLSTIFSASGKDKKGFTYEQLEFVLKKLNKRLKKIT